MTKASLPPGFRFHPTDIELIMYYLKRKVTGRKLHFEAIADVNIYKFSPWDLPDKSCLKSKDLEWFFFCPREKRYSTGARVKRATENGYWKTTGKSRSIVYNNATVGIVKTLVFHLGHPPKGQRTDWVIYEYTILDKELSATGLQDTYVLCKVFKKSGLGPNNGAHYGAPFNEAEWSGDDIDDAQTNAVTSLSPTSLFQDQNQNSIKISLVDHRTTADLPLVEQGPSCVAGHLSANVLVDENDHEIVQMLSEFTDDTSLHFDEKEIKQDDYSGKGKILHPCSDGYDVYDGLGDLDICPQLNESQLDLSRAYNDDYSRNQFFEDYIELADLTGPINSSSEFVGPVQLSDDEIFGPHNHWMFQPCYSGGDYAGLDRFTLCTHHLPEVSNGYYRECTSLGALQMPVPSSNVMGLPQPASDATHDQYLPLEQPEFWGNIAKDIERGTHKNLDIPPFREWIPSHSSPSAAEHLALSSSPLVGSSMHIKAEVTHASGEYTEEALYSMMGGSCSCWYALIRHYDTLLYLVVDSSSSGVHEILIALWVYHGFGWSKISLIVFVCDNRLNDSFGDSLVTITRMQIYYCLAQC